MWHILMSHGDKYSKVSKIDCLLFMQLAKAKYVDAMKFEIIYVQKYTKSGRSKGQTPTQNWSYSLS